MVFVTTRLPLARQGLAGGFVNSCLQLGMAIAIGLADVIKAKTAASSGSVGSYKNVFWFGVAAATVSLIILAVWGDVPRAKSEYTADEIEALKREATREEQTMAQVSRPSCHVSHE